MTNKSASKPWLICLAAALFFYYVFFQLAMFNTISKHLMHAFHIHAAQLGYLSSSYFFADALCIIPAGLLLDRFSTRKIALIVMALCVLATYTLSITHSIALAFLCRAITGAGNAFAFLSSMQLASRWLPPKRLALGIGLIITTIMLGGIVAQTPLALVVKALDWRGATVVNATIGLGILIYMFFMIQDHPEAKTGTLVKPETLFANFKLAMRNPQNWYCAAYVGLLNLPISLLGELWGVLYLTQAHHFAMTTATNITSMMFFGMIIGSPGMGWLSDRLQRRRRPMIFSAILLLIVIFFIGYANIQSALLLGLLFFLLGLLASAQVISYPTIAESNSPTVTSTAMTTVAILLNLAGFVAQPLFGWLMHVNWNGKMLDHVAIYSASNFELAMIILPIAFVVSLIIAIKVKETFCKHIET